MSNKKNILILSYTFPPTNGVGGRRWAKFCKYLKADNNVEPFVITYKSETSNSPWTSDIKTYESNIAVLKNNYPSILRKQKLNFIDKIRYKLALRYVISKTKGNYYDPTSIYNNDLIANVCKLINSKKITTIIVSAAPFRWLFQIIQLKEKYKNIKFIADIRDPWTNNKTFFGFNTISPSRLAFEKELEKKCIQQYDLIMCVSEEMTLEYQKLNVGNIITLQNGFDPEDIENSKPSVRNQKLNFILTGTLYNGCDYLVKELNDALVKLQECEPNDYLNLKLKFIGDVPKNLIAILNAHSNIEIQGPLPNNELKKEYDSSHIGMLFLTKDLGYSRSTKFYEYIARNKSIAVFSNGGETSSYVQDQNIGYALNSGNIYLGLKEIINDWKANKLRINKDYNINQHNIETISRKLFELL